MGLGSAIVGQGLAQDAQAASLDFYGIQASLRNRCVGAHAACSK